MKKLVLITLVSILIISCKNDQQKSSNDEPPQKEESAEKLETTEKKVLSPHTSAIAMVGGAHVHIDYSSPGVRNRTIFGGLVAYDSIWQAGAHMVTWMQTNKDLKIQGYDLPVGKYALFMIPSQDEWTIIFNIHWDQHGKDEYDKKDDVMRFKFRPEISEEITEHLVYEVTETGINEGMISFSWEKVTMSFRFEVIE